MCSAARFVDSQLQLPSPAPAIGAPASQYPGEQGAVQGASANNRSIRLLIDSHCRLDTRNPSSNCCQAATQWRHRKHSPAGCQGSDYVTWRRVNNVTEVRCIVSLTASQGRCRTTETRQNWTMSGTTEEHSAAVGQVGEDILFIVTLTGSLSVMTALLFTF